MSVLTNGAAPRSAQGRTAHEAPRPRRLRGLVLRALTWCGLPAVLIAAWWVSSENAGSFYFPPLSRILELFGPTWFTGALTDHVLPSLGRLGIGYALALVLGVTIGTSIGLSPTLRALAEPPLEFFRAIPPPVMVPVLMLLLGIGTPMKVFVIATGALWPILLNTVEGVRGVDEVLRDTASSYRLGFWTRLRSLTLPAASPQIVTGARQSLSIAIILMVISEMFAANNGIGFSIVSFQRGFQIPQMWTGIILLGLIGVALSLLFRLVESRVLAWYFGFRRAQRGGS